MVDIWVSAVLLCSKVLINNAHIEKETFIFPGFRTELFD